MVVITKTKWLKSTTELQTCLGINFKTCFNCQGHSATKSTCGNAVSQASRSEMPFVMLDIINSNNLTSASAHLQRLANLALCKRSHQSQTVEKATQWEARVRLYLQVGDETEVKVPVRPQRTTTTTTTTTTTITPPSTPVANKREERQAAATTRSSRRSAAPPPVAARQAARAPRGSTPSTAIHLEEDSEEDSEEEETLPEPEPVRSRTRGAARAPSVKWEPNGKAGLPYPYPSEMEDRESLEYELAKAKAELAVYEAWARLRKFE
ncbi:hypothetical protein BDP81DRAFT_88219 [Colletotrichum phormii]|uniref:Uncharacterized protein n=1 Tax=Colletotrichum phormii TaxID=359342 RepID=A0AAJ0A468_9PEZI|nr:uncharacterized protein BDP81DRAFT_88219 [Colletotrichum phormii]KAK1654761.1 hypothetical protein BDP81DRAFT_88219 [Colletotrichum phormii]